MDMLLVKYNFVEAVLGLYGGVTSNNRALVNVSRIVEMSQIIVCL